MSLQYAVIEFENSRMHWSWWVGQDLLICMSIMVIWYLLLYYAATVFWGLFQFYTLSYFFLHLYILCEFFLIALEF